MIDRESKRNFERWSVEEYLIDRWQHQRASIGKMPILISVVYLGYIWAM